MKEPKSSGRGGKDPQRSNGATTSPQVTPAPDSGSPKLSALELAAIELMVSDPKMTQAAIAERIGVADRTIRRWQDRPGFTDAVTSRAREVFRRDIPGWLKAASRAADEGDVAALKLCLSMTGLADTDSPNVNFTLSWPWEDKPESVAVNGNGKRF